MYVLSRLPRNLSDMCAFCFMLAAIISIYIFELCVVLPTVHQTLLPQYIHGVIGTFVFVNVLGSLAMLMWCDTSCRGIILPSLLKPCWRYCPLCEANSPPRAFHCDRCHTCILKRDHHCTFAGCCVGLKNFRHYMLFLFYMSVGSLYATVLNMFFIWNALGGFSVFAVFAHIVPFVFWVTGYLNLEAMFYALMSVLSITGFLFVSNLLILHGRQMLNNQTSYEKHHDVRDYNLGWRQNLVESLGTRWNLVWLSPFMRSPLPSDGLQFMSQKEFSTYFGKIK